MITLLVICTPLISISFDKGKVKGFSTTHYEIKRTETLIQIVPK